VIYVALPDLSARFGGPVVAAVELLSGADEPPPPAAVVLLTRWPPALLLQAAPPVDQAGATRDLEIAWERWLDQFVAAALVAPQIRPEGTAVLGADRDTLAVVLLEASGWLEEAAADLRERLTPAARDEAARVTGLARAAIPAGPFRDALRVVARLTHRSPADVARDPLDKFAFDWRVLSREPA
jgi:hypothetical protein